MRFPDARYYERIASLTGFRPEPLERVFRLSSLLHAIVREIGDEVSLRGGTALNLLHLDVPRLSVDIDLDYVGTADATEASNRRPVLLSVIEAIAITYGYEVVPERPSYAMAHLRMHYSDFAGRPTFVKVDVNFLDRVPVMPPERRGIRHPFGDDLPPFNLNTLALPELTAAKMIALCRRTLARDLFDAALLAGIKGLALDEVRTVLVVRGAAYPPPSPRYYDPEVVHGIRDLSWNSEVASLARRPLPLELRDAKSRTSRFLEDLLTLDAGHLRFLDLLDSGELRPDVLPLPELHSRISTNPGLLWRLQVGAAALEER